MALLLFQNTQGESIISFEPSQTVGVRSPGDTGSWYHYLTVAGERVFEYGCPCGTCGIVFRKIGFAEHRLSDPDVVKLLGALDALPSEDTLRKLGRILEPGTYFALLLEGLVTQVEPGTPEDYFATDVVRLFGLEPPDYAEPAGPATSYWRFGSEHSLPRRGRTTGRHRALVTSVVMPLHSPESLERSRVEYWREQHESGLPLTAIAVGVIDNQEPAMSPSDPDYAFEEQFLFTNCLIDGHHRVQAAAESGARVRILSFLALGGRSLVHSNDVVSVVGPFLLGGES